MLDLPYDFDSLAAAGSMSGQRRIIVMDDSTDIVEAWPTSANFTRTKAAANARPAAKARFG
jgi:NADH-quinone oxidoreductase subunit F